MQINEDFAALPRPQRRRIITKLLAMQPKQNCSLANCATCEHRLVSRQAPSRSVLRLYLRQQ